MRVVDKENKPLSEASVTLISSFYPYGHEDFRETRYTDSLGVAGFTGKREWRIEVIALHGWLEYFWNWCVKKPGYATFVTQFDSENDFDDEAEVKLNPGISTHCPEGLKWTPLSRQISA
jgi:hypothetical protein